MPDFLVLVLASSEPLYVRELRFPDVPRGQNGIRTPIRPDWFFRFSPAVLSSSLLEASRFLQAGWCPLNHDNTASFSLSFIPQAFAEHYYKLSCVPQNS